MPLPSPKELQERRALQEKALEGAGPDIDKSKGKDKNKDKGKNEDEGQTYTPGPTAFLDQIIMKGMLKIKPKKGGLVTFRPNSHQMAFYRRICDNRLAGVPTREIHVKDRQVGDTTATAAFMYADCFINPVTEALVTVNDADSKRKIWKIYDRYISKHADVVIKEDPTKKKNRYHSKNEWVADHNDSSIEIELAKGAGGRGGSCLLWHGSECDFWDEFDDSFEAVMSMVPEEAMSVAVMESTLDGGNNPEFRQFVIDSMAGKTGWKVIFIGWLEHDEYTRPFENAREKKKFVEELGKHNSRDKEELTLYEAGIPLEKLNWRRHTIRTKFKGKPNRFKKEFPIDVDEALRLKGDVYFSAQAIEHYRERVVKKAMALRTPMMYQPAKSKKWLYRIVNSDEEDPRAVKIYQPPEAEARYCIGGDVAEGPNGAQGVAESSIAIMKRETGELVAFWSGRVEPYIMAEMMVALGHYYNKALLNPENNAIGVAVTQRILYDLKYSRVFMSPKLGRSRADIIDGTTSAELGTRSTPKVRMWILRNLQAVVNTFRVTLPDPVLISQMGSFVEKKPGQPRKSYGTKDDGVIATGLAVIGCNAREYWEMRGRKDAILPQVEPDTKNLETGARTYDQLIAEKKAAERRNKHKGMKAGRTMRERILADVR